MYWYKEKFDLMTRLMLQVSFPLELFYFYIQHAHFLWSNNIFLSPDEVNEKVSRLTFVSIGTAGNRQPRVRIDHPAAVIVSLAIVPVVITVVLILVVQSQLLSTARPLLCVLVGRPGRVHRRHGRNGSGGRVTGLRLHWHHLLNVIVIVVVTAAMMMDAAAATVIGGGLSGAGRGDSHYRAGTFRRRPGVPIRRFSHATVVAATTAAATTTTAARRFAALTLDILIITGLRIVLGKSLPGPKKPINGL